MQITGSVLIPVHLCVEVATVAADRRTYLTMEGGIAMQLRKGDRMGVVFSCEGRDPAEGEVAAMDACIAQVGGSLRVVDVLYDAAHARVLILATPMRAAADVQDVQLGSMAYAYLRFLAYGMSLHGWALVDPLSGAAQGDFDDDDLAQFIRPDVPGPFAHMTGAQK